MTMITQYEIPGLIRTEIPALAEIPHMYRQSMEIFASMHDLTDCARQSVLAHNYSLAKKCFSLAEKLYRQGDRVVKMMVENIFVYAFTTMMPDKREEVEAVRATIPPTLYQLYIKQVTTPGC